MQGYKHTYTLVMVVRYKGSARSGMQVCSRVTPCLPENYSCDLTPICNECKINTAIEADGFSTEYGGSVRCPPALVGLPWGPMGILGNNGFDQLSWSI